MANGANYQHSGTDPLRSDPTSVSAPVPAGISPAGTASGGVGTAGSTDGRVNTRGKFQSMSIEPARGATGRTAHRSRHTPDAVDQFADHTV